MSQAYDLLVFHSESEKKGNAKYFGFSLFFHFVMISASLFVVVPEVEKLKTEIITIEYQSTSKVTYSAQANQNLANSNPEDSIKQNSVPLQTESVKSTESINSNELPSQSSKKLETVSDHQVESSIDSEMDKAFAKAQSDLNQLKSNSKVIKAIELKKSMTQKSNSLKSKNRISKKIGSGRHGSPQNLEDIKIPELNAEGVVVPERGQLSDEDFESSFKKIDQNQNSLISKHQKELDEQIQKEQSESESLLNNIQKKNQLDSQGMEKSIQDAKMKNASILNQAKQNEQAAITVAATAQAQKWAKQQLAARQKQEEEQKQQKQDQQGTAAVSDGSSGIPSGVRSLDQLRQMPGNPKPAYSIQERKERHQGQVIFYAYITKSGIPTQFKLSQSTGYRNLDGKTLSSLKKWKFYPGQEGWVEIPFKWDIVGGVSEMPTMLRRVGTR